MAVQRPRIIPVYRATGRPQASNGLSLGCFLHLKLLNFGRAAVVQNLARALDLFMSACHRHQEVSGLQSRLILEGFVAVHA